MKKYVNPEIMMIECPMDDVLTTSVSVSDSNDCVYISWEDAFKLK